MKRKVPALTGVIIAAVILSLYCYLQLQAVKPASDVISNAMSDTTSGVVSDTIPDSVNEQSGLSTEEGGTLVQAENPITVPETEGILPDGYIHAKVVRIVDGDTIKAEYKGKEYKVRLLCIDTPESVKEGVAVQPYGKEASEKLAEILLDKEVTLVFEKDIEDNYGRLLAYVILEDGSCVNAYMVEQGLARVDAVKPNTVHRDYFDELQRNAIDGRRGLWSLPSGKRPFVEKENGYYIPRYIDDAA